MDEAKRKKAPREGEREKCRVEKKRRKSVSPGQPCISADGVLIRMGGEGGCKELRTGCRLTGALRDVSGLRRAQDVH